MKNRILGIIIFLIVGLVIIYFITIPKVEKWIYKLPNNYIIEKKSDVEVILLKNNKVIINDYIAEFSYGENYITLKCLEQDYNSVVVNFYIIDSLSDNIYGPYEIESDYNQKVDEKVHEKLNSWIETINIPDGAVKK